MPDPYYTAVLSGPETTKRALEVALSKEGVVDSPFGNGWHGFPDEDGTRWIRCIHPDLNRVMELVGRFHDWRLRVHHPTPQCQACLGADGVCLHCNGRGVSNTLPPRRNLEAEIDELKRLLAEKGA